MNDTQTDERTTLVMRRTFDAPRERVFAAWTTPQLLARFLGGPETTIPHAEIDARPGGSYRVTMQQPGGETFVVFGDYREVVAPERLAMTWSWEEDDKADERETLLTLEFHDRGGKTELVLTHTNFRDEAQRDRHNEGWTSTFDKLARLLAK